MRWLWIILGALPAAGLVIAFLLWPNVFSRPKLGKRQIVGVSILFVAGGLGLFYAYMKWGADYPIVLVRKTCPLIVWFDNELAMCPSSPDVPKGLPSVGTRSCDGSILAYTDMATPLCGEEGWRVARYGNQWALQHDRRPFDPAVPNVVTLGEPIELRPGCQLTLRKMDSNRFEFVQCLSDKGGK